MYALIMPAFPDRSAILVNTKEAAIKEADKLAKENPDEYVIICEAVYKIKSTTRYELIEEAIKRNKP